MPDNTRVNTPIIPADTIVPAPSSLTREELLEASKNLHQRRYVQSSVSLADQKPIDPKYPVTDEPLDYERTTDKIEADARKSAAVGTPGLVETVTNWLSAIFFGEDPADEVDDSESSLSQNPELAFPPRTRRKELQNLARSLGPAIQSRGDLIDDEIDVDRLMTLLRLELRQHCERAGEIARDLLMTDRGRLDTLQKERLEQFDQMVAREKRAGLSNLFDRGVGLLSLASMALKALSVGATPTVGAGLALLLVLSVDENTNHAASNALLKLLFDSGDQLDDWKQRRDATSMMLILGISGFISLDLGAIKETASAIVGGMKGLGTGLQAVSNHQLGQASAALTEKESLSTAVQGLVAQRSKHLGQCSEQADDQLRMAAEQERKLHEARMSFGR